MAADTEHFSIVNIDTGTVVLDTAWPHLMVAGVDEAMMVSQDQWDYDLGNITAADFIEMWGVDPDSDYLIAYNT